MENTFVTGFEPWMCRTGVTRFYRLSYRDGDATDSLSLLVCVCVGGGGGGEWRCERVVEFAYFKPSYIMSARI